MIGIRLNSKIVLALLISFLCIQCKSANKDARKRGEDEKQYSYLVKRSDSSHEINSEWNKKIWNKTSTIVLDNYMGDKPSHFPETRVKLRYDEDNIYVIFNVSDKYVKAVEKKTNGKVWLDSCVEFFFSPGPDIDRGYFNFEANCKGVFLFQYHTDNGQTNGFVSLKDCEKVRISHSLERSVEQEIAEHLEWQLEYSIPFSVLNEYMKVEKPLYS